MVSYGICFSSIWLTSFSMITSMSILLLLQTALFHSFYAETEFEPRTSWLQDVMCGATYIRGVNSSFLSPEAIQTFILSYIQRRKVLFLRKGTLGISKQIEVREKRIFIVTLKSQNGRVQTHEMLTGPAALTNFPRLWQSWPQTASALQKHTRFVHLSFFYIKLTSPKICILFSGDKDLQHEASTHPVRLYTTWKILEMSCSNKFSVSWVSSTTSSEHLDSNSVFKFWKIAAKTISVQCRTQLKKQFLGTRY